MDERFMPTREALQDFSRKFPEINASAVEVLILCGRLNGYSIKFLMFWNKNTVYQKAN